MVFQARFVWMTSNQHSNVVHHLGTEILSMQFRLFKFLITFPFVHDSMSRARILSSISHRNVWTRWTNGVKLTMELVVRKSVLWCCSLYVICHYVVHKLLNIFSVLFHLFSPFLVLCLVVHGIILKVCYIASSAPLYCYTDTVSSF